MWNATSTCMEIGCQLSFLLFVHSRYEVLWHFLFSYITCYDVDAHVKGNMPRKIIPFLDCFGRNIKPLFCWNISFRFWGLYVGFYMLILQNGTCFLIKRFTATYAFPSSNMEEYACISRYRYINAVHSGLGNPFHPRCPKTLVRSGVGRVDDFNILASWGHGYHKLQGSISQTVYNPIIKKTKHTRIFILLSYCFQRSIQVTVLLVLWLISCQFVK